MRKVVFKVDKFTDFAGKQREVIFAAVSQDFEGYVVDYNDEWGDDIDVVKEVRIGISAQNPKDDVVKTELGKVIAQGKAIKDKSCFGKIYSTDKGFINKTMVDALLEQEVSYFKQNPGKYLAGYNRDKALFLADPDTYYAKIGTVNPLPF